MAYSMTAFDLHFLIMELQVLVDAKVDKVYQPEKKTFLIVFHIPNSGKKILRIGLPDHMFLTDLKGDVPEQPSQFCMFLRKSLSGARLRSISQAGSERVAELRFEAKDSAFILIIELFSAGNLVFCDDRYNIRSALVQKRWKDRTIRGNITYEFPRKEHDFLTIGMESFIKVLSGSDKSSTVKALALALGMGGRYAEEICARAAVDKDRIPGELTSQELSALFLALDSLRKSSISAYCIRPEGKAQVSPVRLRTEEDIQKEEFESFNQALDSVISVELTQDSEDRKQSRRSKEVERLRKIISEQEEKASQLSQIADENQRKGELIFENYQLVEEIIREMSKAKKNLSAKEIKQRIKGHGIIKEFNEKDKSVSIEIG